MCIRDRTSNPGGADFEELVVKGTRGDRPLYEEVARRAKDWIDKGLVGLVVGATMPEALSRVRVLSGAMPILIPGLGAQGGDLEASVRNGSDVNGRRAIINAARSVIYASKAQDFADAARAEAVRLRDAINRELARMDAGWT